MSRDERRELIAEVEALIDAIDAVKAAKTPEEQSAAELRLDVECALSHEMSMQRARRRALDMIRRSRTADDPLLAALDFEPDTEET